MVKDGRVYGICEDTLIMAGNIKTNVMRILDKAGVEYKEYDYLGTGAVNGVEVATALKEDADKVFKTLVTVGKTGQHYVFMIPVAKELDLKKAANSAGEKAVEMIKSKDLLPLTGYIHGGCSPIGMKKLFPTFIHKTASGFETIMFSGGKVGYQVELSLMDLRKIVTVKESDLIRDGEKEYD